MKLLHSEQPIDNSHIEQVASLIHSSLPEELIAFYLKHNGGAVQLAPRESNDLLVEGFYSIHFGERTVESMLQYYIQKIHQGIHLFPFAYDSCGNDFVINLTPESYGQVILYVRDAHIDISELEDFVVCDTFTEFLDELAIVL